MTTKTAPAAPAKNNLYNETTRPAHTLPAAEREAVAKKPQEAADAALLDQVIQDASIKLDKLATRYTDALQNPELGRLNRAMITAKGVEVLRNAITTDLMKGVMALLGKPYGFKADRPNKNNPAYTEAEVKECFIHSLLMGANLVGNEWNIIAGQLYLTQNYYYRKIISTAGITDFKPAPGIPFQHNGQTVVRFAASWKFNGLQDQLIGPDGKPGLPVAVITNSMSSVDAIIGKAKRKAYKAIYEQLSGTACTVDGELHEPEDTENLQEARDNMARQEFMAEIAQELSVAETVAAVQTVEAKVTVRREWLGPAAKALADQVAAKSAAIQKAQQENSREPGAEG